MNSNATAPTSKTLPLLLMLLLTPAACGPAIPDVPALSPPLTQKEQEAILAVQLAVQLSDDDGEDIWPGFHVAEVPILIFRPGARSFLLMALPETVPEFAQRIDFDGLRIPAWVLPSARVKTSPRTPFSQDFPLGGIKVFLVRHDDSMARENFFRLAVHERFHHYQSQAFLRRSPPKTCRFPYEDQAHAFLIFAEERLLRLLLSQPEQDAFREGILRYFSQRKARYSTPGGEQARSLEEWEETTEGTARYVEEMYALAAELTTPMKIRSTLISYFAAFDPKSLQKWRYYRTGIVVAMGLDELVPDEWKQQCIEGACLFSLVMQEGQEFMAEAPAPQPASQLLSQDELTEMGTKMSQYLESEQEFLQAWKTQGAYSVQLELNAPANGYYTARGVTFALQDCSRVVTGISSYVDRNFGLEIRNRTVRMINRPGFTMLQFHHNLGPGTLQVDGVPFELPQGITAFTKAVEIHLPDFEIRLTGCGTWNITDKSATLTLTGLPGTPKCP